MPLKEEVEIAPPIDGSQSIFGQSRIQKGRQLAQSTDATVMQQYLSNNVSPALG